MSNPILGNLQSLPVASGACPFCDKQGLMIFPLRQSALCCDDADLLSSVPESSLGVGVSLQRARHIARMMREGYLYVLVERPGLRYWQGYFVTADAYLYAFPVDDPPSRGLAFSCSRDATNPSTSTVAIERPEEVAKTWWLFTPDPLSEAKLADYKNNAERYASEGRMQTFSPADWVAGSHAQDCVIEGTAVADCTAEFRALDIKATSQPAPVGAMALNPLYDVLYEQAYPPLSDPFAADLNALQAARPRLERARDALMAEQGACIVLRDNLGVTQELNAWRNAAMEGLEPWMQAKDKRGVSNEWKYHVATRLQEVREGIETSSIQMGESAAERRYREQAEYALRGFDSPKIQAWYGGEQASQTKQAVMDAHMRDPLGQLERDKQRARAHAQAKMGEYAALLDGNDDDTRREFDRRAAPLQAQMRERVQDHLAWLQSPELRQALHAYDENDLHRGWAFAVQTSLAMTGMEASEQGQTLLDQWAADTTIREDNLLWRTYALNQRKLTADTQQTLAESNTGGWDTFGNMGGAAAVLLAAFKHADEALAECEKTGKVAWFQRSRLGALMGWYAQLGRAVFKTALPAGADRHLAHAMVRVLQARLGSFATQLRMEEMHAAGKPLQLAYARGQINRRIREGVEAELGAGRHGQFYGFRFALLLSLTESVNLLVKARELPDSDATAKAEVAAAGVAVFGGSLEMMGLGGEWAGKHFSAASNTARIARTWGGALRLYGGFLGGAAGIAGSVFDVMSAFDASDRGRQTLTIAYGTRALVVASATVMGTTIAFAGSAPYMKLLMERSRREFLKRIFAVAAKWASKLALRQALLLSLRTWGARLGWIGLGLTAVVFLLTPDEFENWCEKSVFRKDKSNRGFANQGEELAELELAFRGVAG